MRALLSGEDPDADHASARLGFRLAQRHVAVVLWTDTAGDAAGEVAGVHPLGAPDTDGGDDELGLLERTAVRMANALGGGGILTVPAGSSALWAWLPLDSDSVAAVAKTSKDVVTAPVRMALGMPATGTAGFRQSHHEAIAARQVVERAAAELGRVVSYAQVETAYLAGADAPAMRALIRRELGQLARPGSNSARLRETLLAYLRCHRSPEGAAAVLGVHKNTVRYRIQRIEELLGRRIDECGLRLELALECAAIYGV